MRFSKFDFLGNLVMQLVDDMSLCDTPDDIYIKENWLNQFKNNILMMP